MTTPKALRNPRITRAALLLVISLTACAPSAIPYESVRITADPAVPENCRFLGEVSGGGEAQAATSPTIEVDVEQNPIISLRQATADLCGDTVSIVKYGSTSIGATAFGHAYDCRGYNPQ